VLPHVASPDAVFDPFLRLVLQVQNGCLPCSSAAHMQSRYPCRMPSPFELSFISDESAFYIADRPALLLIDQLT
jgi:hypothetical protein